MPRCHHLPRPRVPDAHHVPAEFWAGYIGVGGYDRLGRETRVRIRVCDPLDYQPPEDHLHDAEEKRRRALRGDPRAHDRLITTCWVFVNNPR